MDKAKLRKGILATGGILAVGLAVIGIFVPVLPTTPFLLLAAACFVRSSDRLYHWLIHHQWFGPYIRHYREYRAITLQAKIVALALLWGVIGYTALAVVNAWWLRGLLCAIAVGVTLHLLHMKTLTPDMLQSSQRQLEGG
ncbi:MAG: YbaN family protein [Anaerolineae bacterium]